MKLNFDAIFSNKIKTSEIISEHFIERYQSEIEKIIILNSYHFFALKFYHSDKLEIHFVDYERKKTNKSTEFTILENANSYIIDTIQ